MIIYRQGDVILVSHNKPEGNGVEIPNEGGRIVLAHGEVTGHSHSIAETETTSFALFGNERVLVNTAPVTIWHEEHAPITLPPGSWEVRHQREYTPAAIRSVID